MTLTHIAVDLLTALSSAASDGAWSGTSLDIVSGGQEDVIFQGYFEPLTPECDPIQLLADPGFELSTGEGPHDNPYWTGASTHVGRPFCSLAYCDVPNSGPHTGSFWVLFGDAHDFELSSVYQDVVMPVGQSRVLNYWLRHGGPQQGGRASLDVLIDGHPLAGFSFPQELWDYKQFSADVSEYADGGSHRIEFKYYGNSELAYRAVSLDDVTLDCAGAAH